MSSNDPTDEKVESNLGGTKVTYKSFRKKYRKMRIKFEEKMNLSNQLLKEEQEAAVTEERLAFENDQLLDLLLDINNSTQIPGNLRFDLTLGVPALDDPLKPITLAEWNSIPSQLSNQAVPKEKMRFWMAARPKSLLDEFTSLMEARVPDTRNNPPTKSLVSLIASTPHVPFTLPNSPPYNFSSYPNISPLAVQDLSEEHPVSYLSPTQLDDHLFIIDASLKLPPAPTLHEPSLRSRLSEKELNFRNPNSVYNWLRKHEPKIFLQDGEGSEKSAVGKAAALRGAGKRAGIPAPSRPDMVEFVEEDGIGYDASLSGPGGGGSRGKRKRVSDEDAGYRPKGGSNKPTKKKRKDLSGEFTGGGKGSGSKSKGKNEADMESSMMEIDT